eukprot:TRINITY_DN3162_c0_g2_i6.p2 TRINITY_DN3162_c0_g2~~TRINITY_DN3162_c0_g2_i6.p2  ORF type:complete len:104 (-),score=13.34 TRINITY_DN3162_c0_g2_i6:16-327(-)
MVENTLFMLMTTITLTADEHILKKSLVKDDPIDFASNKPYRRKLIVGHLLQQARIIDLLHDNVYSRINTYNNILELQVSLKISPKKSILKLEKNLIQSASNFA